MKLLQIVSSSSSKVGRASKVAGLPSQLTELLWASPNYAGLQRRSLHAVGRTRRHLTHSFSSKTLHRLLSTGNSTPVSQSSEVLSTTPTSSEIFESSSQELWAADAAKTLEEGETLASLGLGGYSPIGLVQQILDYIHSTTGLPWWVSIAASTIVIRSAFIPLLLIVRQNAKKMVVINPQLQKMRERQKMFLVAGDYVRSQEEKVKVARLCKEHGVHPFLAMVPLLLQGGLLVSYFGALRGMAVAPVTSMMSEGTLWFVDLTSPDAYFILPIVNSSILITNTWLGGDSETQMEQIQNMKKFLTVVYLAFLIPMHYFPSGVLVYLVSSSSFSIVYTLVMKGVDKLKGDTPVLKSTNTRAAENDIKQLVEVKKKDVKQSKSRQEQQSRDKNRNSKHYKRKTRAKQ